MFKNLVLLLLVFMTGLLGGCAVVGDIFKAGVWVGVLIVVGIIALVIFIITRGSNKS
jgi:hypothetical protein